jgi:hypothetical protein
MKWDLAATYSNLDNDVPDGSVAKSIPWGRTVGITDFGKDDTLIEVDTVVCNITNQKCHRSVWAKHFRDGTSDSTYKRNHDAEVANRTFACFHSRK